MTGVRNWRADMGDSPKITEGSRTGLWRGRLRAGLVEKRPDQRLGRGARVRGSSGRRAAGREDAAGRDVDEPRLHRRLPRERHELRDQQVAGSEELTELEPVRGVG